MIDKPAEILLFDFLAEKVNSAVAGDALYGIELHDTVWQTISTDRGLRISDAAGELSPGPGMVVGEYDVFLTVVCYSRVKGVDQTQRQEALIDLFAIQKALYEKIIADPTLGGRVCDSLTRPGSRSYDSFDGNPYAVANMPMIINPSGARYSE